MTKKEEDTPEVDIKELKAQAAAAFEDAAKKLKNARTKIEGEELETLVLDLEEKLRSLAPEKIPDASELEKEVKKTVQDAEKTIKTIAEQETAVMKERAETLENFISDHPIASVAIAASAGFLIGLIASKLR